MAAYTLADISQQVARALGTLVEGIATAGSQTTITDTVRLLGIFPDDNFNKGMAWILYDAGGAGVAPQGEYGRITDFVKSTGVVTMDTLTAAVAAGDRYALSTNRYGIDRIISAINQVLTGILVKTEDISTITTASAQTEYNLPAAVLDENIEIEIQTKLSDTNDYKWTPLIGGWHIAETATGTAKLLIFDTQPPVGYLVKVIYHTPHPALYINTAKLREGVPIERVVYGAALQLLYNDTSDMAMADPALPRRIAQLEKQLAMIVKPSDRTLVKLASYGAPEYGVDRDNWN